MKRKDRQDYAKRWKRAQREMLLLDRALLQQQPPPPPPHQHPLQQMPEECEEEPELALNYASSSEEDNSNVALATCLEMWETPMDKLMDETSDSCSEERKPQSSLRNVLQHWALEHQIQHSALDDLLVGLKANGHPELPSTEELTQREVSHPTEGGGSDMKMEMRGMRASINRMRASMHLMAQVVNVLKDQMDELLKRSLSPPAPPVEDFLLLPCLTVTELQEFDRTLCQPERRNNMQLFLSTLGGCTGGDATRRMLRQVATNDVLRQYSLRGRKTKKAFQDLAVCRVITAACQKNVPALTAAEAEDLIGQVLKFAPHRRPAEKY